MAPHSSTLAWKIPWMEEPGRLQSMGSLRVGHDWVTSLSLSCIGEGNGNPLQCSCLENPRDRGPWRVPVYGVTQSRTRLKWLSSSSNKMASVYMSKLPVNTQILAQRNLAFEYLLCPIAFTKCEVVFFKDFFGKMVFTSSSIVCHFIKLLHLAPD